MIYRLLLVFIYFLLPSWLAGQRYLGQYEIVNYEKKQYNGGAQNWSIRQDLEGRMYFANNEGVLSFDGAYWKLFPLPNKTITRAIEFGKDHRLYVGGQDEFGYFSPDARGSLEYHSLVSLLPENDRRFADIWDIVSLGEDVFFRSTSRIFRYNSGKVSSYQPAGSWSYLGLVNGRVLAQDGLTGIHEFRGGRWQLIIERASYPTGLSINEITGFGLDSALVTTNRFGLFKMAGNTLHPFNLNGVELPPSLEFSTATVLDPEKFLIGTYSRGFYLLNREGRVLDQFSKAHGLQNGTVRAVFLDRSRNLWLGLDSGIDFIPFNDAIKHINPPALGDGAGYAVTLYKNELYFGLSTGIYAMSLPEQRDLSYSRSQIRSLQPGMTYGFSVLGNELLAGRGDGFFQIADNLAKPVSRVSGFWTFQALNEAGTIAAGNYLGIRLFDVHNGVFTDKGSIPNFNASSRFLVVDNNRTIWVSHPYRGVYRIGPVDADLNYPVRLYTRSDGLPSDLNNHIFKLKNRVVIATEKGIYEYDPVNDGFKPAEYYTDIFGERSIRYLKEDGSGNIWFVQEKNIGVVDFSTLKPRLIYLPELTGKINSGFEHIFPLNESNIFIGGEKGFYHINFEKYKQNDKQLDVYIRSVRAMGQGQSILYGGYGSLVNGSSAQLKNQVPSVKHNLNSFHFEYSASLYEDASNIEYSYKLENFDRNWSDWSRRSEKDYTNLPAGTYTFQVRTRNNLRTESRIATFKLTVLPPWYQTIWAYSIYMLAILASLWGLYKKQQKKLEAERLKHREEKKRQAYLHQLELEKSEKEVVKLRNEKLEAEIGFKNSQLASTAMHLVQKEEYLQKIREELQHMNKVPREKQDPAELKKILRIMAEEDKVSEEWDQFSVHFDQVNGDFLQTLKERYPDLKAHELKLCAYLRMNLSSKEIAQLMSISVRGVEISRYRLRKKLQLPREANLFQFLFDIQKKEARPPELN